MRSNRKRSLAKTFTWRISATLLTILIAYIFTKNVLVSLGIGGTEVVLKTIWYYFHERIWNMSGWGKG